MIQVARSTSLIHKKYCYVSSAHKVAIKHKMPQTAKMVYVWRSISSCLSNKNTTVKNKYRVLIRRTAAEKQVK
jgi:hypothetical protein